MTFDARKLDTFVARREIALARVDTVNARVRICGIKVDGLAMPVAAWIEIAVRIVITHDALVPGSGHESRFAKPARIGDHFAGTQRRHQVTRRRRAIERDESLAGVSEVALRAITQVTPHVAPKGSVIRRRGVVAHGEDTATAVRTRAQILNAAQFALVFYIVGAGGDGTRRGTRSGRQRQEAAHHRLPPRG